MEYFVLDLYKSFSCMAGKCTATCCAGWKILIDKKDYERFCELPNDKLKQDILSNIQKKEDAYYFMNRKDGSCAMLDADGLCRIQRNTDEKTLCNTCRKYPRIINTLQEKLYLSMAASCPVIADYIVSEDISWECCNNQGKKKKVPAWELPVSEDVFAYFLPRYEMIQEYLRDKTDASLLFSGFEKIVNQVLEIILMYHEGTYLLSLFEAIEYETECDGQKKYLLEFVKKTDTIWAKIRDAYLMYRFPSRRIEHPKECILECIIQTEAELLLIRTVAFCFYLKNKSIEKRDWSECIQKVYRFCVHGKKVADAFHDAVLNFFSREDIWTYLLF